MCIMLMDTLYVFYFVINSHTSFVFFIVILGKYHVCYCMFLDKTCFVVSYVKEFHVLLFY